MFIALVIYNVSKIHNLFSSAAPCHPGRRTGGGHWGSSHELLGAIYRAKPKAHVMTGISWGLYFLRTILYSILLDHIIFYYILLIYSLYSYTFIIFIIYNNLK